MWTTANVFWETCGGDDSADLAPPSLQELAAVAAAQAARPPGAVARPREIRQAADANHAAASLMQAAEAQQAAASSIASAAASLASAAASLASIAAEAAAEANPAPQGRSPRRGAARAAEAHPRPSKGKGSSGSGKGYRPF